MALRIIGTIPDGTCYPAELQDLVELLAPVLDAGSGGAGAKEIYIQVSQPMGVPEETAWFQPVTRILKFYGRQPGDLAPSWFDITLPAGSVTTDLIADEAVTQDKLSTEVQAALGSIAAASANAVLNFPEPNGGGSYRANFFLMADGTVRATGVSKITVNSVDKYKNGTGFVSSSDASVLPKRAGFSPPLAGDTIAKVYASQAATFAVTAAGLVYSTGMNNTGQLGLGDTTDRTNFVQIAASNFNSEQVLQLAIGTGGNQYLSCYALTAAGKVYAWGHNYYGQLGFGGTTTGNTNQPNVPTYVTALGTDNAEIVSAGAGTAAGATVKVSAYVRKTNGDVYGCGFNGDGQLGQGNTTASSSFIQISALSNITKIRAAGDADHITFYAAELNGSDGKVWAVGYNNKGQVGDGTTTNATSPNASLSVTGVAVDDIACFASNANFSVLVQMADGTLRAWGSNANKQLGLGSGAGTSNVTSPATPTVVDADSNALQVQQIAMGGCGGKLSSALTALKDGTTTGELWVMTAGGNQYGQLGLGTVADTANFTFALIDTFQIGRIAWGANNSHPTAGQIALLVALEGGLCLACGYDAASIGQLGVDASPASISIPAFCNF